MNCTEADLVHQLGRVEDNHLYVMLATAASQYGVSIAFLLAVASRETNMRHIIGDEGHGVGILQLDTQHPFAARLVANGTWNTPDGTQQLINACTALLASDQAWAEKAYPQYGGDNKDGTRKLAADAYNAGVGGAGYGASRGDADMRSTGHDYGSDVIERMHVLEGLLGGK